MSQVLSRAFNSLTTKGCLSWNVILSKKISHALPKNISIFETSFILPVTYNIASYYHCLSNNSKFAASNPNIQQVRHMSWGNVNLPNKRGKRRPNKHKDPKGRKFRAFKVLKVELPNRDWERKMAEGKISPEEMRAELKLKGMLPPSRYMENPFTIAATGAIFDEYKPTEGETKIDWLDKNETEESSGWSISKAFQKTKEKGLAKTFRASRKIRTFDDNFDGSSFATQEATEVYINAHKALAAKEEKRLHQLATEKVFPEMMNNTKGKSIYWDFIKSLDPPHVVQVRCQDIISKSNVFAQVTVRFHTQQILAVYDRFGRLIHGNPHVAKDVLEYVVFEKHLADTYGKWRLHAKIIPQTAANERLGGFVTHVIKDISTEESDPKDEENKEEVIESEKKYGISYKSDKDKEPESVYDRFGRMIGRK